MRWCRLQYHGNRDLFGRGLKMFLLGITHISASDIYRSFFQVHRNIYPVLNLPINFSLYFMVLPQLQLDSYFVVRCGYGVARIAPSVATS